MKTIRKIFFICVAIEFIRFIVIAIFTINSSTSYSKESYFSGTELRSASTHKDVVDIIKKNAEWSIIIELSKGDEVVFTSFSCSGPCDAATNMEIYNFDLNQGFSLSQSDKSLDLNWWNYIFYGYDKFLFMKSGLKINSLEYYFKGEMVSEKDSLDGRLQTFVVKPDSYFEIGFNNDLKTMINIDANDTPLSVTFYQKNNILFLITLRSNQQEITSNTIENYIYFE